MAVYEIQPLCRNIFPDATWTKSKRVSAQAAGQFRNNQYDLPACHSAAGRRSGEAKHEAFHTRCGGETPCGCSASADDSRGESWPAESAISIHEARHRDGEPHRKGSTRCPAVCDRPECDQSSAARCSGAEPASYSFTLWLRCNSWPPNYFSRPDRYGGVVGSRRDRAGTDGSGKGSARCRDSLGVRTDGGHSA